jgi:uncharacterized membrane protein (DUF2068 family)
MSSPIVNTTGLRLIASVEAIKGLAALAMLIGVLDLLHHDLRAIAMALIGRFGLDPEGHYSSILLHYAELIPQANKTQLIELGLAYVGLRWLEAYGLWFGLRWAEYLAASSGAIYIPFELRHVITHGDLASYLVLIINMIVVTYLCVRLIRTNVTTPE